MAKRNGGSRATGKRTSSSPASTMASTVERRLVAFAEQLGRIAGTLEARAEHLMDRETLSAQIASVRDGAAALLAQLAGGAQKTAQKTAKKAAKKTPAVAKARGSARGRSGGVVDAPGKKHRKPLPSDPDAATADSQAAKMRTAMPMSKTKRLRGRG
jgi:hypothetical protein